LSELVQKALFRADLYYRLSGVDLRVPSLRERRDDIRELAVHFLERHRGARSLQFSESALQALCNYHWPGNVRELENVVERSVLLAQGPRVEADDVKIDTAPRRSSTAGGGDHFLPEGMTLDQYEQAVIREALKRANGNKSQAARLLGLTRNALRYRLAQMGIE
jgi:DNA-binding NtrC family response regulator